MLSKGLTTIIALVLTMLFLLVGASNAQQGASPQKDKPSVDRLNVEDFERKPETPRPKPKPRPQPGGTEPAPTPVEQKPQVQEARLPAPGEIWREAVTGLEFVRVPGGCFDMGSPASEQGRKQDEGPVHEVCVDGLWMGKTEVTVGAFRRFVEATGHRTDAEREGFVWFMRGKERLQKKGASWRDLWFEQKENHPVVNVSWNDATAMAEWLSRQTGAKFRLPTEAEWEYCCRSGTKTSRFWGDSPTEACRYGNVLDQVAGKVFTEMRGGHDCDDGNVYTSPVGRYQANSLGLFDMLGNASEWCEDVYHKDAYTQHPQRNPRVTGGGSERVYRGGGWYSPPVFVRCADRGSHDRGFRRAALGFRLVKTD
jgi:formylglycine-generating enzyme